MRKKKIIDILNIKKDCGVNNTEDAFKGFKHLEEIVEASQYFKWKNLVADSDRLSGDDFYDIFHALAESLKNDEDKQIFTPFDLFMLSFDSCFSLRESAEEDKDNARKVITETIMFVSIDKDTDYLGLGLLFEIPEYKTHELRIFNISLQEFNEFIISLDKELEKGTNAEVLVIKVLKRLKMNFNLVSFCCKNRNRWQEINLAALEDSQIHTDQAFLDIVRDFIRFLILVNRPTSHIIKVYDRKETEDKVKWIKSDEHYCVIDFKKNDGATNLIIQASNELRKDYKVRMAHSRRAHFRRLKSDFYKHRKGQTVWIRESWVGPREWIGTDKKIYQVVDWNYDR